MRKIICFKIDSKANIGDCWQALEAAGFSLLYSSEDPSGDSEIYAVYHPKIEAAQFPFVKEAIIGDLPEIDWEAQWESHGANFKEGYVHVDLHPYGYPKIIKLQPGPGFGDLSHPTTHLVLEMMPGVVEGKKVIDVGSGSGILSFAAEAMGASSVTGIDIDPEAIQHANDNARLNSSNALFCLPGKELFADSDEYVILINMIQSEQIEAWKALQIPAGKQIAVLASGILNEGKDEYLKLTQQWGLRAVDAFSKEGWVGFRLTVI